MRCLFTSVPCTADVFMKPVPPPLFLSQVLTNHAARLTARDTVTTVPVTGQQARHAPGLHTDSILVSLPLKPRGDPSSCRLLISTARVDRQHVTARAFTKITVFGTSGVVLEL